MDSPNDFEVLRMLNAFARSEGISLANISYERFFEKLREALAQHKQRATLMHGLRTQSMFLYVVAALGGASIISEEDRGEFYAPELNITCIPHFSERLSYEKIAALLFTMRCRHESALQRRRI